MAIKIENVVTPSAEQWNSIVMGARNPLNSWSRSDSTFEYDGFSMGDNDHDLLNRLAKAGTDHRKFMRMIPVYVDITAPLYWLAELDTYKIGTVRNSCSFMHKGLAKTFDIHDFSIKNEAVYEALSEPEQKTYELTYPYETDEFKRFEDHNGRTYRVYRNGRIIREAFEYVDSYGTGRTRHFEEAPAVISQTKHGYFNMKLSGRGPGHILVHRLVAELWCDKPKGAVQVDHIDGNKGNNSAENLEWVTAPENMQRGIENGLFDNLKSLHKKYLNWKYSSKLISPENRFEFMIDCQNGMTCSELSEKWGVTPQQANNSRYLMLHSENEALFQECYIWDKTISYLNELREEYLETGDSQVFQEIRCLLPQGYMQRSTFMFNYEVLANIYKSRKNHKLDEWHEFCDWIETLPYAELITGEE